MRISIAGRTAAGIAILIVVGKSLMADVVQPQQIRVIDGDTIAVNGKTIHLIGFTAPEKQNAQCKAERDLGDKAANRLRELVLAGGLEYSSVMCPCPASTLGKWFCKFGRSCGTLKTNGRDVGDILVEEGLAAVYSCAKGCPKTTRLWC